MVKKSESIDIKEDFEVVKEGILDQNSGALEAVEAQPQGDLFKQEHQEPTSQPTKKKLSKNEEAKELMKSAAMLVNEVDNEVNSVKSVVSKDIDKFEEAKTTILDTTIVHSMILLEKANFEHKKEVSNDPFEVSLDSMTETFSLSKITSGRFTGFLLAIISMIITVVAWILVATYKTGLAITLDKLPNETELNTIFTWIGGGMTGGVGNPDFGMIAVAATTLLIGWTIYKLHISIRETRNARVAHEALAKSNSYVAAQKEVKTEMERIDEHVKSVTDLVADYKVLLEEQNAKLKRILHVEGILESSDQYHYTSQQVMEDSDRLMKQIENLLSTSITKERKLNEAAERALIEAKALYGSFISRIYNR